MSLHTALERRQIDAQGVTTMRVEMLLIITRQILAELIYSTFEEMNAVLVTVYTYNPGRSRAASRAWGERQREVAIK